MSTNTEHKTHGVNLNELGREQRSNTLADEKTCISTENLSLYYGEKQALKDINITIPDKKVSAFIGPSGCGKSTLLRCFNRMNDLVDGCRIEGKINIDGNNIYDKHVDVSELRRRVGMVFQKPNPFPKSIYETLPMAYVYKV